MLRPGQLLFTYLHLAPDPEQTAACASRARPAIAYETVEDGHGRLPLLAPMSEIAGKIATQAGAFMLEKPLGGRGILLGGVPGVPAANVMVIGGGVVGMNAAFIAIGMEADVFVYDTSIDRLRELDVVFDGRCSTVFSNVLAIEEMLPRADLVIGAVLVHGARAPQVIRREQLALMKPGAVLVDVAIDQGGCFETSRPTTHQDPTYEVDGIIHYCVANMPGAVPITSTQALTNATMPYAVDARRPWHRGGDPARSRPAAGRQRRRGPRHPCRGRRGDGERLRAGGGGARPVRGEPRAENCETGGESREMATATATKLKNVINGEAVDPAEGKTEEVVNPANGEVIAEAPLSTKEDVDRAVEAARSAFEGWSTAVPGERAAALLKLADLIEERAEEIADLESADAGKPRKAFLEDEIPFMADNLRFFAGAARNLEGKAAGEYLEGYTSMVRREPIGVVGQITPWNYPLMMAVWKIGPALAAGNTIVLKPAETTPVSDAEVRRVGRGDPARRRLQRDRRPRRAGRVPRWSPIPTSRWSR